ncbi:tRNA wybutosine-synthesizing protein 2 homolog [Ruditapes philippinarum]|uniref:tRNA wybutosine-synthesizing protein 2 homolog n=1 Tax=Ruditapes philippinarum TaxID=129788 RepID=UPI00295AA31F|nr:tRNA wybutosine-synthesizing protein 2 homolog [Ruditapes philippinarum]
MTKQTIQTIRKPFFYNNNNNNKELTAKMDEILPNLCVTTRADGVNIIRKALEELKLNDASRRLKHLKNENLVAIPIKPVHDSESRNTLDKLKRKIQMYENGSYDVSEVCIRTMDLPLAKKLTVKTPQQLLKTGLKSLLEVNGYSWTDDVINDIPTHWERHGDLVLIPGSTFTLPIWLQLGTEFWPTVTRSLSCKRIARKCLVSVDQYRTPQVIMLYGDNGWVEHVDNGIKYTYDVTKCMFSAGNITEKLRVAGFQCSGEVVVDLYAGIGYFTLPYLVYTGVKHLHACEWNPHAVEALHRNLILNKVDDRCTVHHGDNKEVCPRGVADRVNLGLIPSSREGWPVACRALKPDSGGILHIHYNVNTKSEARSSCHSDDPQQIFRCEAKSRTPCDVGTDENDVLVSDCQNVHEYNSNICDNKVDSCLAEKHTIDNTASKFDACVSQLTIINDQGDTQTSKSEMVATCSCNNLENYSNNELCDVAKHKCCDSNVKNSKWYTWAEQTGLEIREMLQRIHGGMWTTQILHIEHVKSYAPYVDHIVLDLKCKPVVL